MGCCCQVSEPPDPGCDPVVVSDGCSIPSGSLSDSDLSGVCGAPSGGGCDITMTEVGTATSGEHVGCGDFPSPTQDLTVDLSGLQDGCVLFFNILWSDTVSAYAQCGSVLGGVVQPSGQSGPFSTPVEIHTTGGFDWFGQDTQRNSLFWAEVTGNGSGQATFTWPDAFQAGNGDLMGLNQIQVFQVCGDCLDASQPIKAYQVCGLDRPVDTPEAQQSTGSCSLPPDDCPAVWFAAQRHSNYVGNQDGHPDGAFDVVGGSEVAEYVPQQNTWLCQAGTGGGTVDGDSLTIQSSMNTDNFFGDLADQSIWTMVRLNCSSGQASGGEQVVGQCCVQVTNDPCNTEQQATVNFSIPVTVSQAAGSDITVELLYQGGVVAQLSSSGTLSHSTVTPPLSPGATSPNQCYSVRVVCDGYEPGNNQVSWGQGEATIEVGP